MDTKKATLRYFGSSTVEVCMLSTAVARNHAHSDFYFNTMRIKIRLFLHRLLTFLNPKHDEVTEVETSVEKEIKLASLYRDAALALEFFCFPEMYSL